VALPVTVAAPVGGAPGTKQLDWHAAACELHTIMQVVIAEVCARRILPGADAAPPTPAELTARSASKIANRIADRCMSASRWNSP
jgi:hypothetical protein